MSSSTSQPGRAVGAVVGAPPVRFGTRTLDAERRELRVEGELVDLEPRTFDVLAYLLEHRERVVPKEELLDTIWGDRFVSESALTTRIKHARAAVGDDGRTQHTIRTVHRVGYRFVAEIVEHPPGASSGATTVQPMTRGWSSPPDGSVFGRDADVDSVAARLRTHRLVTVTGPAGVGKSTLARRLLDEGPAVGHEHRHFCELDDTRDPNALANVVLHALGAAQQPDADPTESLLRVLEARRDLIVLDGCEHVVDAVAVLAERVLDRCPSVRILATSREPLELEQESVHPLQPLDPEAAVECFAARAVDAGTAVDVTDPALGELCERLDRVPLAIELAAARARLLTPTEMIELLDDRFRLLRAAGDPRGRSLRAAIASSWDALGSHEQALLALLSVFVGTFTLEDARAVAMSGADPLDAVDRLERLVRRSLVTVTSGRDGRSTFRLLESVRDFAAEQLVDQSAARRGHVAHFVERAARLDAEGQTPEVDRALTEFGEIWANLRAAVGYAAEEGDVRSIRRIVCAVAEYADVFAVYEVAEWCERAGLTSDLASDPAPSLAADALAVWARTLAHQGDLDRAGQLSHRAREVHESHATLLSVVWCAYYTGELDRVIEAAPRLVELSRSERGLDRGYADGFAAIVAAVRQEPVLTSAAVDPADAEDGVLGALDALTDGLRLCTAAPGPASELLEAVVETSIRNDYRLLLGAAASTLTQITLPARPPRDAMVVLRRTLTRYRERSMWNLIAADIVMAARLLADAGMRELAARLVGARLESGYSVGLSEVLAQLLQDELAQELGDEYPTLVDQGRAWRPPEAAAKAIDGLSRALRATEPEGAESV